ncbi:hypothetical protein [Flavobacterium geliluteum]|uniref:Lipoprotein n=1 Tax=Flavobacterium geliluteum TaxID=2816120 RepID=A0A940XHC3_9FLAO|nr:hypothetical protein [Flavobacterium geliluteum]MBP4139238.1 hypothetical protein [Flavobacterium geliluteum]
MKTLILALSFFLISIICNASDTISVWHVYYNKVKIKEYNQYNNKTPLIIKSSNYKIGDSITVKYFSDANCNNCSTGIMIGSEENRFTMTGKSIGTGNPISFPVSFLINSKKKKKKYTILYLESNGKKSLSFVLFEVQIE